MSGFLNTSGWLLATLIAGYAFTAGIIMPPPPERSPSVARQDLQDMPLDAARIIPHAKEVRKNRQGFWEAELMYGIELIYVPSGYFSMGSPRQEEGREPDEGPVHRVRTSGIWIGKYEVTREIWREVMGGDPEGPETRRLPMSDVSYLDVQEFLSALRNKSGLGFRLPTEAEWEKACRGGGQDPRPGPLDEIAWHVENSGGRPHPVGTKRPNDFGLYDMLGNVWEWCGDWYGPKYYAESPDIDPAGPARGKRRVVRGGGFAHGGHYLRSAHRNDQDPARRKPHLGFRLVLDSGPALLP